ncbi:MAG: 16S rRNA (cytidine(1402)-2'-O)-methyltransferase [Rhizobiaceae bacterium]
MEPGLYVAATPIGNLRDITIRVLDALAGCDLIACEDTRVTAKLLRHYGIRKKTVSYTDHNANVSGPKLIEGVKEGKSVVLVSDAGTPLVSDPGLRLVAEAREHGIPVIPLPGASATLTALVASGLTSETWIFAGFLPSKQGARIARLRSLATNSSTVIFFESPNRLEKALADMVMVFGGDRIACVARELTKLHEDIRSASLSELADEYAGRSIKGEIVILIEPADDATSLDTEALLIELLQSLSVSQAAAEAAQLTGGSKRELYQQALALKEKQ